jgi:hypothetical protein
VKFDEYAISYVETEGCAVLVQWGGMQYSWLPPSYFSATAPSASAGKAEGIKSQKRREEQKKVAKKLTKQKKPKQRRGGYSNVNIAAVQGTLRSCMQDAAMIAAAQLGVRVDEAAARRQVPALKTKNRSLEDIEGSEAFSVIKFVSVQNLFGSVGGPEHAILQRRSGVFFVVAKLNGVFSENHAFVYNAGWTSPSYPSCRGLLIDNRAGRACVLDQADHGTPEASRKTLSRWYGDCEVRVLAVHQVVPHH